MKFRTKYGEHLKVDTAVGSPVKIEYQLRIIDGEEKLVETGKSDWYAYIQSHKDSVDIHKILERCAMLDDYSPLMRMPAQFMDVTQMPKNLAEAHTMIQDAKNFFEQMPIEIKQKYENNYMQFISDIGSEKFMSNVSNFLDSIKQVNDVKENVENES